MRKIKVLHVTSTPRGIGGVERLLLDLSAHYDRGRFEVMHCNLFDETGGEGPFPKALGETGLRYVGISGGRWLRIPLMVRRLRAIIKREKVDILHLHMAHATVIGGLASLFTSARVLVTKHYTYAMLKRSRFARLDRFFTNRAHAIAAISAYVAQDLVRHNARPERIRVVHNGTDLARFDERAEGDRVPIDGGAELRIACIGRLDPLKGHDQLIRAMPEILRSFPSARLLLIGEGPLRKRLEDLSASLGVADSVTFTGFVENVPALLSTVELCVQPSRNEAFGIVLLEAMAAGRPVVAMNVGGMPEIVDNGVTGLLVGPGSAGDLSEAICKILGDRDLRAAMGKAGRDRVEREFRIEQTARGYESLYENLSQ